MKEEHFQGILRGLSEARAFARGENVPGLRVHLPPDLDVAAIRKKAGLSQSAFSGEIGFRSGHFATGSRAGRAPDGPARVLLAMLTRDPAIVRRTLGRKG